MIQATSSGVCEMGSETKHVIRVYSDANFLLSDLCLSVSQSVESSSGKKRRLTQRTLLQLNFTRPPKDLSHDNGDAASHVPGREEEEDDACGGEFSEVEPDAAISIATTSLNNGVLDQDDNCFEHVRGLEEEDDHGTCEEGESTEVDLDSAMPISTPAATSSNGGVVDDDNFCEPHNLYGSKLQTFIVGRRYADQEEMCAGAEVSLLRDPQNVKDPNAIKVSFFVCL